VSLTQSDVDALVDDALGYTPDVVEPEAEVRVNPEHWRQCLKKDKDGNQCPNFFEPVNSSQKYCPADQPNKKNASQPNPKSVTNHIKVTLPGPAKGKPTDDVAKRVEEGAAAMLGLIPVLFAAIGDETCSAIFTRQLPAIAHQLGEVARYHKGLEKFFAGAEGTGELFAWVGLAAVTLPALIAVLLHHDVVKGALAARLQAISDTLEAAGGSSS
jgi:hypothetical protein